MKVKRSVLEKIVREELAAHVAGLLGEAPEVADAEQDKKKDDKKAEKGKENPKVAAGKPKQPEKPKKPAKEEEPEEDDEEANELPVDDDSEADDELEDEVSGEEEDADEVTGGKIAKEITGKTLQSVTMEPKSKILPGAQEITLTFKEIPDQLKILVTKTGMVKFSFRGLHNTL